MGIENKFKGFQQIIISSKSAKKLIKITVFPLFLIFLVFLSFIMLFDFSSQKIFGIIFMMIGGYLTSIFAIIFTHYYLQSVPGFLDLMIPNIITEKISLKSLLMSNIDTIKIWIITAGVLLLSIGSILTFI